MALPGCTPDETLDSAEPQAHSPLYRPLHRSLTGIRAACNASSVISDGLHLASKVHPPMEDNVVQIHVNCSGLQLVIGWQFHSHASTSKRCPILFGDYHSPGMGGTTMSFSKGSGPLTGHRKAVSGGWAGQSVLLAHE